MPRIPPSESEMRNRILVGSMENRMRIMGYGKRDVASKVGMPENTFYYRLRNPETFNVKELRKVFKILKYPAEEAEQILKQTIY